jgi:hypothetical protein
MQAPRLKAFIARHRVALFFAFLAIYSVTTGYFMWQAKTTHPTLLEAEEASCRMKCSPRPFRLETTRQERAYQNSWRGPPSKYPECICG